MKIYSQLKYITYKIYNNTLLRLHTKRIAPMVRVCGSKEIGRKIYFQLNHPTTHLGDRLFVFQLIKSLLEYGFEVYVSDDEVTRNLLRVFDGFDRVQFHQKPADDEFFVIAIAPSFSHYFKMHKNCLILDFTDTSAESRLSKCVNDSLNMHFGLCLQISQLHLRRSVEKHCLIDNDMRYYVFNNYIYSGTIRKYFINNKVLSLQCEILRKLGYKIIHIGGATDKYNDKNIYDFVDLDLRGRLTFDQTIRLLDCDNVVGAVTYDNFIMHMMGILNKPSYVKFRGRLLGKNAIHHFNNINNNFYRDGTKITYI